MFLVKGSQDVKSQVFWCHPLFVRDIISLYSDIFLKTYARTK